MVKFLFQGQEIFMDGYLDNAAKLIEEQLSKDNDCIGIVDGGTGSGKSCMAQQLAARIDPTFSIDRACFDADEFKTAIINAKPKQAVIFDEALNGLNIRRTMSSINVTMTSLMTEIRQKNLIILMCLPSIYDMDKSAAIHRSQFLIHVYLKNGKRGYFRFYGKKAKARLFGNDFARRTYQYLGRSTFWGQFKKGYVIDEKKYRKKKDDVLKKYLPTSSLENIETAEEASRRGKAETLTKIKKSGKITNKQLVEMGFGSRSEVQRLVNGIGLSKPSTRNYILNTNNPKKAEILEPIE